MYTDTMRRAFKSISAPKDFRVSIIDNEHFLTIKLNEYDFLWMSHDEKMKLCSMLFKSRKHLRWKAQ